MNLKVALGLLLSLILIYSGCSKRMAEADGTSTVIKKTVQSPDSTITVNFLLVFPRLLKSSANCSTEKS